MEAGGALPGWGSMGPRGAVRWVAAAGSPPGTGLTVKESEGALRSPHTWRTTLLRAARRASES